MADGGQFTVSTPQMAAAARMAADISADLQRDLKALSTLADAVAGGSWSGQAGNAFAAQYGVFAAGQREVLTALDLSAALLASNGTSYAAAEKASAEAAGAADSAVSKAHYAGLERF